MTGKKMVAFFHVKFFKSCLAMKLCILCLDNQVDWAGTSLPETLEQIDHRGNDVFRGRDGHTSWGQWVRWESQAVIRLDSQFPHSILEGNQWQKTKNSIYNYRMPEGASLHWWLECERWTDGRINELMDQLMDEWKMKGTNEVPGLAQ